MRDSDYFETNASQNQRGRKDSTSSNKALREQIKMANCELIVQSISIAQIDQIF